MTDATRRGILHKFTALPLIAFSACRAARAARAVGSVDVTTLRQSEDSDDTPAMERALQSNRPIWLPAGGGTGPGGDYIVDMLDLRDGASICGDGPETTIRSSSPRVPSIFRIGDNRPLTRNVTLRNMTLTGYVASTGFQEHHNLVNLSGVADCLIDGVVFRGFAGDGLYIGGEHAGVVTEAAHNSAIDIRNCVFDGINNDNRNGISVTGGVDIRIDRCRFIHCTRHDMPGPIDFEANDFPFYVFERISVTSCTFEACGGNVGQISVITPAKVKRIPRGVRIANNHFMSYVGTGSDVAIIVRRRASPTMPSMDVVIENNIGVDGRAGVRAYSGRGIRIRNNRWIRYLGRSFIGYTGPTDRCSDVSVSDCYERCGMSDGVALGVYNADAIEIENCRFINCGDGKAGSACIFLGPGQSNGIALINNDFSRNGPSVAPVHRDAQHLLGKPLIVEPVSVAIT